MSMQLALPGDSGFFTSAFGVREKDSGHPMKFITRDHPERASVQGFISDVFFKMYRAEVRHFGDTIVGFKGKNGEWIAASGISYAKDGATFLEQYLDAPVECEIAACVRTPVARAHIVEVGNLAAIHNGAAREMIIGLTRYLHQQGLLWVTFTATRALANSFARLNIQTTVLASADPARLPDGGKNWGTYYDTNPQVMFGNIRSGYAQLAR